MIERLLERERRQRGHRALVRQLRYQEEKSRSLNGFDQDYIAAMQRESRSVRSRLEQFQPIATEARVLEVGSGAHWLIFYFDALRRVGVDPLARHYASLFPGWQSQAPTVAAVGNALPFPDASFDVVLCDNVVDHAEDPKGIVVEMARVLAPNGYLYFTVNVHHRLYWVAAFLHRAWNAAGIRFEIGPFADHTVHLTPAQARRLFDGVPMSVISESADVDAVRAAARETAPRHPGDLLKRVFFKNAAFEVVARRSS